jgi:RNA polymerase sigma-70 factor, ECF subfamily
MTRFVRATQADVWRLCAHLADPSSADDLTQETYLRAFRSLRSFRGESPVRPWLLTIARRVVADEIASRQRHRVLVSRAEQKAACEPGTPDHADSVASHGLLKHLEQDRRVAFVLTQLLGYSYAEAGEVCECPVGTIRSRVARARGDLLALLADQACGDAVQTG